MRNKIAMAVHLSEHQECTGCHCFTEYGYILRDRNVSRFVCSECYEAMRNEYPVADKVIEIKKADIERIAPEGKKPGFQAGYLIGKKESTTAGYKIQVHRFFNSIQAGKGTANFFNKADILKIREISRISGDNIVGLFRTSPSGSPDFNLLDNTTMDDLLLDIVYVIIGGNSEIQIAAKDRQSRNDEIGVILL